MTTAAPIAAATPARRSTPPLQANPNTGATAAPPGPGQWKAPVREARNPFQPAADLLLKKYAMGRIGPNAERPVSLNTMGPNGKPVSMLIAFCGATGAKVHAFLTQVLLPVVEELASARHDGQPAGSETFNPSKEIAATHLLAGATAAIAGRNPKSLGLLYQMARRHFPTQLPAFIEGYLRTDPRFAKIFLAAGVPSNDLQAMLTRSRAPEDDVGVQAAGVASAPPAAGGDTDVPAVGAAPRQADVARPAPAASQPLQASPQKAVKA